LFKVSAGTVLHQLFPLKFKLISPGYGDLSVNWCLRKQARFVKLQDNREDKHKLLEQAG
jgi:hypothetical protein